MLEIQSVTYGGMVEAYSRAVRTGLSITEAHSLSRDPSMSVRAREAVPIAQHRASVYIDLSSRAKGSIPIDATPDQIMETRAQYAAEAKEYHDYLSRLDGELAALVVLGPEAVREAAEDFARLAREQPTTWFNLGRDFPPLVRAIREALDIPT